MGKIKFLIIITLITVYAFRLWQTSGCKQFVGFYFNPLSIKISVESQVNLDQSMSRQLSRLFHNKVTAGIFEFSKAFSFPFDTKFLMEILGPIGLVLVVLAIFEALKARNLLNFAHLSLPPIFSAISLTSLSPKIVFYLLALTWYSLAFKGTMSRSRVLVPLFLILIPLTFWYFLFSWQIPTICHEIFFN